MSGLKNKIKNKYQAEVNPKFTEAAWDNFVSYQELNKGKDNDRKRFLWIFLLGFTTILGFVFIYFYFNHNGRLIPGEEKVRIDSFKESANENPTPLKNIASTLKIQTSETKISTAKVDIPLAGSEIYNSFKEKGKSPVKMFSDRVENTLVEKVEVDVSATKAGNSENRFLSDRIEYLRTNTYQAYKSEDSQTIKEGTVLPLHKIKNNPSWTLTLFSGIGKMPYRSLNDVRQYVAQVGLQYGLTDHWKVEGILAVQRTRFSTKIQNRSLGIRSIALPGSSMNLSKVTSTTNYFEMGMGLAYEFGVMEKLNFSLGTRLSYIQEISRNLNYEFEDSENKKEEIFSSLNELNSHPYNMDLNASILYKINRSSAIGISGSYIQSISNRSVKLPTQWRILVGVTNKF